jgi:hypothetical protein
MSSSELLRLLAAQWPSPDCAFIPEFRGGTGWSRESRADAIAMHCWPSMGLELVGFELKISRGDWLRERKQPWKADPIKQRSHLFFVGVFETETPHQFSRHSHRMIDIASPPISQWKRSGNSKCSGRDRIRCAKNVDGHRA